jgi:hypothetical protein
LSRAGRLTQSWKPWNRPPRTTTSGGASMWIRPRPAVIHLGVAVGDQPAAAVGVLVPEDPVDHVGDGLEPAVGMPGGALGLARGVVDLTHLVHVHERVEGCQVDAGEGAADGEALAFQARTARWSPRPPGGRPRWDPRWGCVVGRRCRR